MLTVVYVLVSTEKDYFYEQFLMSVTSLHYQMKEVNVVLLVEQDTNKYIQEKHSEIKELVDQIIIQKLPVECSMAVRSRMLKTSMRNLIDGDFLYIDCDTVICSPLDTIQSLQYSSAVLDNHYKVTEQIVEFGAVIKRAEQFGFSVGYNGNHFNSGVLWCKDDDLTREFFGRWNEIWNETCSQGVMIDQLSFNEVNNQMNGAIAEMEGEWNCQLRYGLPYLKDAKIIHYFASNLGSKNQELKFACEFTSHELWKKIRNHGRITDEIYNMLCEPKRAFKNAIIVEIKTENYYIINSNIVAIVRAFYRRWPKTFWKIDSILGKMRRKK